MIFQREKPMTDHP